MKKIYAGSDHGGFLLKQALIKHLKGLGYEVADCGTNSLESCDYPDFAHITAKNVLKDKGSFGLLVCGSGIGMSIAANRHAGIRAALCHNELEASLARQHNNANILALGARITGEALAISILNAFLAAEFEGGRHQRRIDKIEPQNQSESHNCGS